MIRLIFRVSTIVINSMILFLTMYFWRGELQPIKRGFLVIQDLKYVEFIERMYNGNVNMETFSLKTLGVKEKVKQSSYNSGKAYFGFGATGSDIGLKPINAPISNLNSRAFFDALEIVENKEYTFASPATIYERNAHLYTLINTLCKTDTVKESLDKFNTDKLKWQSDNSFNSTMERFCTPSYPTSTDFTYCYASVLKHKDLTAVMFFTMIIPFILYIIYFTLEFLSKDDKESNQCKIFYYIEDANAYLNAIYLTAFSMELANGLPSGIPGSFCPEDVTGLYVFYLRFIFIFIFISTAFIINIFSAILDLVFYTQKNRLSEKQITWWKVRGAMTNTIEHAGDLYEYE